LHIRSSIQLRITRKFYFSDVSIACASLNIDSISKLANDEKTLGMLFENLAIHDLKIYASLLDANCYFFRDNTGYEIDLIMEFNDGT
jgi:predicted AAA+ superfamily ATPase